MRKQFIIILLALLVIFGLMVSCKNEVSDAGFGEELVSVSFGEYASRGLTATLEGFDKDHLYWAYAAQKADGSNLISGQTANYGEKDEVRVWVKTDGGKPVAGLGSSTGTSGYKRYQVPGFSQGYWNFKLYAYKTVLGDNPDTEAKETDYVLGYVLVYQGETKNALLKSDSTNEQGSHLVNVIVDPVQSSGNGTMVFLTNNAHDAKDRISMNTVNSAEYGTDYTVKVLSILSMEELPVEYVGTSAEIDEATDTQDGLYSLPAGSYKVTVAFTDDADNPAVNYAKGTIVATVYSNLTTTISGDLTEAMTYAEFDGILNPDLETVTASNDQPILITDPETTVVLTTKSSAAKEVTASIKAWDTNRIINSMADAAGTNTDEYDQNLNLTLSVETVETTATTATYEIGMSAKLTSLVKDTTTVVSETTSDVSEVEQYVTVEVQLETGLTQVNVLHDGKQMIPGLDSADPDKVGTFAYNGTTGILTIKTMSFSPFEVSFVKPAETSYVAQVGKVKYQRLDAAISAAKTDGTDTITLLNDVTLASATDISKKVVLDLAGYRIKAEAGLTASVEETTIKNGNIDAALTISGTGVKLSAVAVKGSIAVSGSAAFDSDCSVTGTGEYAINVTGSITIDGGTYTAAEGEGKYILSGKAAISDGNFNGSLAPTEATGIVLKGGTYTEMQAASRLAPGFDCAKISDGVYMVRNIVEAVNVRTKVEYHYLQNAIDAASAGDTVKLLRNVSPDGTITVGDGVSITLDLAGLSLVGNVDGKFVNVLSGGTLVITDSSEGKTGRLYNTSTLNQGSDAVCCAEGGTLTIKAGNFGSSTTQRGGSVRNFGTTVIDGGTFTSIKNGIAGYAYSIINAGAGSLTLNGGEIYGDGQNGGIAVNSGTVVINDIKVNDNEGHTAGFASYGIWITNDAENGTSVVVNGGYFKGNAYGLYGSIDDGKQDEGDVGIVLKGGTFIGNTSAVISAKGSEHKWNLDIYGGSYSSDPSTYVADGYEAIYSESSKLWTVEEITPETGVASITRNNKPLYFTTLQKALYAAVSGETIDIIKNFEITSSATVTKAVTIDGHNYVITNNVPEGNYAISIPTSSEQIAVSIANLTINATARYVRGIYVNNNITFTLSNSSISTLWAICVEIGGANTVATLNSVTATTGVIDPPESAQAWQRAAVGMWGRATITINGGNYTGPNAAFIWNSGATLNVNSGSFGTNLTPGQVLGYEYTTYLGNAIAAECQYSAATYAHVVINGGTFTAPLHALQDSKYNHFDISGGTFTNFRLYSNYEETKVNQDEFLITGGTYDKNPEDYGVVASGYMAVDNGDGTWTVWEMAHYYAYKKGMTVLDEGTEDFDPTSAKVSKVNYHYVDGTIGDDPSVYRMYSDGKMYIYDLSGIKDSEYTFRSDVSGIRWWNNNTIKTITVTGELEQAYQRFRYNSVLENVVFSEGATRIPHQMFRGAPGVKKITIPATVSLIENQAIYVCDNLEEITIEGSTVFEASAIRDCPNLKTITFNGAATVGNYVTRSCPNLETVYLNDPGITFTGTSQTFTHADTGADDGITIYCCNGDVEQSLIAASGSNQKHWTIKLTGGSYDYDPSARIADGCYVLYDEISGLWTIYRTEGNAEIAVVKDNKLQSTMSLLEFAGEVNSGESSFDGCTVILLRDIDLDGAEWTPIGNPEYSFSGLFDGANHTISNYKVTVGTTPEGEDVGGWYTRLAFFYDIYAKNGNTAGVKNLVLKDAIYGTGSHMTELGVVCVESYSDSASSVLFSNIKIQNVKCYNIGNFGTAGISTKLYAKNTIIEDCKLEITFVVPYFDKDGNWKFISPCACQVTYSGSNGESSISYDRIDTSKCRFYYDDRLTVTTPNNYTLWIKDSSANITVTSCARYFGQLYSGRQSLRIDDNSYEDLRWTGEGNVPSSYSYYYTAGEIRYLKADRILPDAFTGISSTWLDEFFTEGRSPKDSFEEFIAGKSTT